MSDTIRIRCFYRHWETGQWLIEQLDLPATREERQDFRHRYMQARSMGDSRQTARGFCRGAILGVFSGAYAAPCIKDFQLLGLKPLTPSLEVQLGRLTGAQN